MDLPVTITFDCTPLRSISRFDIPLDASPTFRRRLELLQAAVTKHGTRNTYYLTDAKCQFRFTNNPEIGWVKFAFEGTVITNDNDSQTIGSDLIICLDTETCDWLTQPAVEWLALAVEPHKPDQNRPVTTARIPHLKSRALARALPNDATTLATEFPQSIESAQHPRGGIPRTHQYG